MKAQDLPERGGRRTRGTWALASGSALAGLLSYAYFAVVTRALGPTEAAPFSVLWTFWAYASAALTFPIQHWASQSVARQGGERALRQGLPWVAAMALGLALTATLAAFGFREVLFPGAGDAFPVLVGLATLGAAGTGLVRGVLTARGRLAPVAVTLVTENAARLVLALVLAVAGVDHVGPYGATLVAGYLAATLWPSTFRLGTEGRSADRSPWTALTSASSGQLLGHTVLTSGPVLLAFMNASPDSVTRLFAGMALFRAPYLLALGAVAGVTTALTRAAVAGDGATLARFRRRVALLAAGGTAGAALVGALIGPWTMHLVYGSAVTLPRTLCALLAVGSTLAVANLVLSVLLLACNRVRRITPAWLVALVPGALILALVPSEPLTQLVWAFVGVETVALGGLLVGTRGLHGIERPKAGGTGSSR